LYLISCSFLAWGCSLRSSLLSSFILSEVITVRSPKRSLICCSSWYNAKTLELVDAVVSDIRGNLEGLEEAGRDLSFGIRQVHVLRRGLENAIEEARLGSDEGEAAEYTSALPPLLFGKLSRLLWEGCEPQKRLKERLELVTNSKVLRRFAQHFDSYLVLGALVKEMGELRERLAVLDPGNQDKFPKDCNDILFRCKQKVDAWEDLRGQAMWFTGTDE